MAIGATDDPDLAARVGEAIGLEARAMGVNVVYAPVLDVATAPANAAIGIRSFGDDPAAVAALGVAFLAGCGGPAWPPRSSTSRVLATRTRTRTTGSRSSRASRERLEAVDLVPFRAAIDAGVPIVMSSHVAVPALNDGDAVPSTLAPAVMTGLLRGELGFEGVTISDALDMRAIAQGEAQAAAILAALRAGVDLLLCGPDRDAQERIEAALLAGAADGRIDPVADAAALARIDALRRRLAGAGPPPDLGIVGGPAHAALARELAERSLTLVRDDARRLPLALPADATILAVMPDADRPHPGRHLVDGRARPRGRAADQVRAGRRDRHEPPRRPTPRSRPSATAWHAADAVVVGTIDGAREPSQLALLEAVAAEAATANRPVVAVALRTPWDVASYPAGVAAVCTYSIHTASMVALADALSGAIPFAGRLPVRVDGVARGPLVSLHDEILEQPAVASRFLETQAGAIDALAAALRDRREQIEHVVIAARGSSDHAAIYAQYVLGIRHGLTVGPRDAVDGLALRRRPPPGATRWSWRSASPGASPDIVAVVDAARRQGAPTVAITNDTGSALAAAADWTIDMSAGPERSIAATKTYTASLLAIAALSAALGDDADRHALASMPAALASMLELEAVMASVAEAHAHADRALVVARGYEYATAREWAIKIKELAHVFADPYSAADFQHGPVALVEPGVPVIVVVRDGPAAAGLIALLGRLRDDLDADVTVLSDVPEALAVASRAVALPPVAAEWLAPIATVVAGQLHALHLTRARGLDPDAPRSISKVTRTR